jgi:hypothetical protein
MTQNTTGVDCHANVADALDAVAQMLAYAAADNGYRMALHNTITAMYQEANTAQSINVDMREAIYSFVASYMCHDARLMMRPDER